MAQLRLTPPEQFDFKSPDDWPRWKRRFKQFRIASGLSEEGNTKQVSTLLYCLGEESEAVLASTNATVDERKVYNTVMQKFDAFFGVRKNVIFERAQFNRRKQQEGESAEQFIMELYRLAENCNYGELQSEMIRDRLVVGITDGTLSERLQLDPELTLEKAKKMVRQREAVHEQQKTLNGGASNSGSTLDEVKSKRNWKGKPNKAQPNNYRNLDPEHAIDAGMPGTRGTNVLQKKQSVLTVRKEAIIAHSAISRECRKCQ